MPYITDSQRWQITQDGSTHGLIDIGQVTDPGRLNYAINVLVNRMLDTYGLSYAAINTIIGALECAKLELYRRVAAPYEDTKARLNGEVLEPRFLTHFTHETPK